MQKIVLVTLFMVLLACAQKPIVDYDAGRNLAAMHSYAWQDKAPVADDALANNTLNDQRVRVSVDDYLAGLGMSKVAPAQAEVLLTYRFVTRDKINSNSTGMGFGLFGGSGGLGLGGTVSITQYEETELFIDMLDPRTQALMWRGSTKYSARSNPTPEQRAEEIRKKVNFILSAFPPK